MQWGCPGLRGDLGWVGFEGAWKNPLPCPLLPAPRQAQAECSGPVPGFLLSLPHEPCSLSESRYGVAGAGEEGAGAPGAGRMAVTPSPDRSVLGLPKAVWEFCVWTLVTQVLAEAGFAFLEVDDGELFEDWNGKPAGAARGCLLCVARG